MRRKSFTVHKGAIPALAVFLIVGAAGLSLCHCPQVPEAAKEIRPLIEQGDLVSAEALVLQALKVSPRDPNLYNLQGVVKAQQGDFAGAESSFEKAIQLDPRSETAFLNLGHLYQERIPKSAVARDDAISVYTRLLDFKPTNVEANYQSALLLMQKGFYRLSLDRLAKLPPDAQGHAQTLAVRCADYAGSGEKLKTEETANAMLQSSDLTELDVMTLLPLLARQKNTSLQVKLLEGLEGRNLDSFDSLYSLGLLYKQQGRLNDARKLLDKAAHLQPESVAVLIGLARVANDQEDYTGALGYLAHARDLEPNNAAVQFFWGIVSVELNLVEDAYWALKKAVSLDPNNAYYNYAMGAVAMARDGVGNESIPYFQKYSELKPLDPRGRLALGSAYFNSADDENSKRIIATVVNYPETRASAHYYLGRISIHKRDYAEAMSELQIALKANPGYVDAYAELGNVYLSRKEYPQAEQVLKKALKLSPDSYTANLNLMLLYQKTKDPRADEQMKRYEQIRDDQARRAREFLRAIDVRP